MRNRLKALRTEQGMTQQDIADKLGIKVATYRTWENGYRNMSLSDACDCANILGCTLDELAGHSLKENKNYYVMQLDESTKDALVEIARAIGDD